MRDVVGRAAEPVDVLAIASLVAPAASLVLLFVGGFVVYLIRTRMAGAPDREMRERGASLILGPFVRDFFAWLMSPLMRLALTSGMPANFVTYSALFLATGSGIALGSGHFAAGGWLFLGSGFCDYLDGRVARCNQQTSKSGALLDSVFDRYGEGVVFIGLAWFYRDSWVLLIVAVAAFGSQLVSYLRARCWNEGVDVSRIGILLRPERIAILGTAICLSPIVEALIASSAVPNYHLAITGLTFVAILSNWTAVQRLNSGMKQLREHEAHHKARRLRAVSPTSELPS